MARSGLALSWPHTLRGPDEPSAARGDSRPRALSILTPIVSTAILVTGCVIHADLQAKKSVLGAEAWSHHVSRKAKSGDLDGLVLGPTPGTQHWHSVTNAYTQAVGHLHVVPLQELAAPCCPTSVASGECGGRPPQAGLVRIASWIRVRYLRSPGTG